MKKMYWRKSKTLALLNNRRQWLREFSPEDTVELELSTESGTYFITETSDSALPTYYRTE
jgi:hypothetical protein